MRITKIFEIWEKSSECKYEHKGACVRVLYDLDKNRYKFTFRDNKKFVKLENVKNTVLSELYSTFTKRILEALADDNALYQGIVSNILSAEREIVDESAGLRLELVELHKNWGYTF